MPPSVLASPPWRNWMASATLCALSTAAASVHAAAPPSITAGCPQPRHAEAFEAAFTAATVQRHDVQQLTCAAAMSASAAQRASTDMDLQVLAMDAQINLLEELATQMESQFYQAGDAFKAVKARWALGTSQGKVLSARMAKAAEKDPTVAGLRIAFDLVSVSTILVPPDRAYVVAASHIEPLIRLLEKTPSLLDGAGEMMLGRLYFQLPETAGGDLDKAVVHLGKALEASKKNIVFMRWLAESLMATGQPEPARAVLARMLPLQPEPIQRQSFADSLRAGIGLAQRAGDNNLSAQLQDKRSALLKAHPELLTRQAAAVSGHGGFDPFTGKTYD